MRYYESHNYLRILRANKEIQPLICFLVRLIRQLGARRDFVHNGFLKLHYNITCLLSGSFRRYHVTAM